MQKLLLSVAAAALLAAAPAGAIAQAAAPSDATFVDTQTRSQTLASTLIGTPVRNTTGTSVGDINDLVFSEDGTIETIVIGIGGFLGVGEKNVAFPYTAAAMKVDKDKNRFVMVNTTKAALEGAKPYVFIDKTTLNERWQDIKTTTKTTYEKAKEETTKAYNAAKKQASETYEKSKDAVAPADEPASDAAPVTPAE